jgi:hypothetical protein
MPEALLSLAVLACPVGMGLMMWLMMRGSGKQQHEGASAQDAEIAGLRAELDQLRAAQQESARDEARPESS